MTSSTPDPRQADRGRAVAAMFASIAPRYDRLNLLLSFGRDRHWRRVLVQALPQLHPRQRVLDLCAGTGDVAIAVRRRWPDAPVHGCDFCEAMLERTPAKAAAAGIPALRLVVGDAQRLPYRDDSFAAVTIAFGLRNVESPALSLAEIRRVLAPGGRLLILEFNRPEKGIFSFIYRAYVFGILPRLGRLLSGSPVDAYRYLPESVWAWPDPPQLANMMERSGLRVCEQRPYLGGAVILHVAEKPSE